MVRIIQISTESTSLSEKISMRKEAIRKISIRTNMQNPIKKWDLVANDDFQNSIFEFFLKNKIWYERRQKEWQYKKEVHRQHKLKYGTDVKNMMQILACYYFEFDYLGPAIAQGNLGSLFGETPYKKLVKTEIPMTFYLFKLYNLFQNSFKAIYTRERNSVPKEYKFLLFTLFLKDLKTNKLLSTNHLTRIVVENVITASNLKSYNENLIKHIKSCFAECNITHKKDSSKILTPSVFSKNKTYVTDCVKSYEDKKIRPFSFQYLRPIINSTSTH